MREGCYKPGSH